MKKTEKKPSLLSEEHDGVADVEKKLAPSNQPKEHKRRSVKKKEGQEETVVEVAKTKKARVRKSSSEETKEPSRASTAKPTSKRATASPKKTAKKVEKTKKTEKLEKSKGTEKTKEHTVSARETALVDILDKIAKVPVSQEERERQAKREEAARRAPTPAEKAYSGTLPHSDRGWMILKGARKNNLQSIDVPFPLGAFTVVTGVSGSGKSSLVEDALYDSLQKLQNSSRVSSSVCDGVVGWDSIKKITKVDQSPIGQTPTSNPATYTGVFEWIRELFAQTQEARALGFHARRFSFNVPGGRCEKCQGAGQIKIEMQFLADVWVTCDECNGKRYNSQTLSVRYRGKTIADVLETTCGDALEFFSDVPRIKRYIQTLCDVGLDYLPLGQSSTTLSGGEAQRVKLATELSRLEFGNALYVLDEPTTGLHFSDVRKLLDVLQKLVDLGNTVVVVEHNLDVIKCADWIVDVGPDAGKDGGRIVYAGVPEGLLEYVAKRDSSEELRRSTPRSYTGEALFDAFKRGVFYERKPLDVDAYVTEIMTEEQAAEEMESTLGDSSEPIWEIDGRRWHLELRTPRVGVACRWDPEILSSLADKIDENMENVEMNWDDRVTAEARDVRTGAWFMRAVTNDEWLLKLRFRAARNAFDKDKLPKELALRPLSEVNEVPLYGIKPRVRVDVIGGWQEIELKVFSFQEIDTPAFWNFFETAMKSFSENVDEERRDEVDLTPWITQGRDWHLSPSGAFGGAIGSNWSLDVLRDILDLFEDVNGADKVFWKKKIVVDFLTPTNVPWARVYTKNAAFIRIQLDVPKGGDYSELIAATGLNSSVDEASPEVESINLIYGGETALNREALKALAKTARDASRILV